MREQLTALTVSAGESEQTDGQSWMTFLLRGLLKSFQAALFSSIELTPSHIGQPENPKGFTASIMIT